MTEPMTDERRAEIREHIARTRRTTASVDDWHRDLARDADDLLAEVDRLQRNAKGWRTAYDLLSTKTTRYQQERDRARNEQNAAYATLRGVLPTVPATLLQAAAAAVKAIRDHDAERGRVLAEQGRLAADRAYIAAALDRWQDGATAPHDVLTAIRDRIAAPEREAGQ